MAKLIIFENGHRYWGLTKPEDYVVIDAIDRVQRYVPKADTHWDGIPKFYLEGGKPLWDRDLMTLNQYLKRKGLKPIILTEGHSDSHSAIRGPEKAQIREAIRQQLDGLTMTQRDDLIERMHNEIDLQYNRNPTALDMRKTETQRPEVPPTRIAEALKQAVANGMFESSPPVSATNEAPDMASPVKPHVLAQAAALAPEAREKRIATFERIGHQKGELNSQYGTMWITREGESKRVPRLELSTWLKDGWRMGRKMKASATMVTSEVSSASKQPDDSAVIKVDDVERILRERRERTAHPTRSEVDELKAEIVSLRLDLNRLMRVVVDYANG